MPFLQSIVDLDLIREIGYHQEIGRRLSLKILFQHGIASVATVQRRLSRLKRLGVVHQLPADHDRRVIHLMLSPKTIDLYRRMSRQLNNNAR